ncbi:hypothetical protein [Nonomuraea wenchangensis]|uniref:Uncharacterized protein n=1 Tax=Nonomuraea wenchangensis TaxID=568860 RepID=A0A1I0LWP4_9ACTN|nr:hypothetical protein [Nonomuraea wenchangensis]SEU46820.1 hypothetical protein SAMN05421811_127151 [Nonomuraea wenchangensis]
MKLAALAVAALLTVQPAGCGGKGTTTDPYKPGALGCERAVHVEAVRIGSAEPRVRVLVNEECTDPSGIGTQLLSIDLEYRESLGAPWLAVNSARFPNVAPDHQYVLTHHPCLSGRYRAKVGVAGTFDTGKEYRASVEESARINCDKPRDISS